MIKNYVELNREDFSKVLETEKRFELVQGEALITGQIDLLKKFDEEGNVREVEIIDFKTEKEIDRLYRLDYELQLRLYAIACMKSLGLNPQQACIHHLDGNKKDYVNISQPDLDKASEEMNKAISNIIDGNFSPKPSENCADCDWQKICSKKYSKPIETKPRFVETKPKTEYVPRYTYMERKRPTPTEKQKAFADYVAKLKQEGITGEQFRNKRDQWLREHKEEN